MTFLPIVERELRVAARKPSTFWLRLAAALAALALGGGFMVLSLVSVFRTVQLGSGLFSLLTGLGLAVALGAGLFFTSDSLSEEKREGTLGLLFLTDLHGYDVVLGKLLATSLRGFYALLAVFPILAITLLMGGVTGVQFWKTVLAIVNALFCSLALGLFVSVLSRDSQRALAGTLGLLVLFLAAGPLADGAIAAARGKPLVPVWSLTSPGYTFTQASAFWSHFWTALVVNQLIAWSLLALACWRAPRSWQERAPSVSSWRLRWEQWWRYGGAKRRARLRAKFLEQNPALWLAARERWQALGIWLLLAGMLAAALAVLLTVGVRHVAWAVSGTLSGVVVFALYLWTTAQACRFFVETRRSGVLELLLATPLESRRIADGGWQALARSFGPPVVLLLVFQVTAQALGHHAVVRSMASAGGTPVDVFWPMARSGLSAIATLANLIALAWFGLWMGLTSKSAALATLKALVFVQILPAFVFVFVAGLMMPLLMFAGLSQGTSNVTPTVFAWVPYLLPALPALLAIAKDVFFFQWSRRKLFGDLRERALQAATQVRLPPTPPVITPNS